MIDIRKENARKAKRPVREIPGIENQYEENPLKTKFINLNPGTINVTKYKVIAKPAHLKRPNVIKFKGKRRILIIGRIISEVRVNTIPAKRIEYVPSAKTIPDTPKDIMYRAAVLIIKCFRTVFIKTVYP